MFRQKGTGNARTGGIRNPIKKGGGHAKQKRPKDWRQAMPKKARRLATRHAILLARSRRNDVRVLDDIKLDAAQDQARRADVQGAGHRPQLPVRIWPAATKPSSESARNIDRTTLTTVAQLNAWDILRNRTLLMTKDGLEQILA